MKDLPQEFFIENSTINVEFLDNRIREITAGVYRVFVPEIKSDCQQITQELQELHFKFT